MKYGAVPNASRYLERGYTYHLTHRCHDRRFLLQTIRERHDYRKWLREGALRYDVPIYNFWEHPFKCTIVQSGQHLLNCMRYVSLNMVRAGVVGHPSQWRWCGDDELMDRRSRYRLVATERMLESLELPSMAAFQRLYCEGINEQVARRKLSREPVWTESLAIDEHDERMHDLLGGGGGHWFPGEMADKADDGALRAALGGHPLADRIPGILREAHTLLFDAPSRRDSEG